MAALLCLSLVVWSVVPVTPHTPTVFETIQEHLEMIADHGHSHGFEEDLFHAIHGHSHDVADHDHNQAHVVFASASLINSVIRDTWRLHSSTSGPYRSYLIEPPPRV